MATAVIEHVWERYYRVDGGGAYLGNVLSEATYVLTGLPEAELDPALRDEILAYALAHVREGTYRDDDLHIDLMRMAAALVHDDETLDRVEAALAAVDGAYYGEQATLLRLSLLRRFGHDSDADDLTAASLQHHGVRVQALKAAFAKTDYTAVEALARGGLEQRSAPGYFGEWNAWLLRVAAAGGNTSDEVASLCAAFVEGYRKPEDPLARIREFVTPERWEKLVNEMLRDLVASRAYGAGQRTNALLAYAGRHDALSKRLLAEPTLEGLKFGGIHLPERYHRALGLAHLPLIGELVEEGANSSLYRDIVRALGQMRVLGTEPEARVGAAEIREGYKRRRTLMELLGEAGW